MKWYNEGELSNKYFFNLLNRRSNEEINNIFVNDQVCSDKGQIEGEIRNFYKNLYESVPDNLEFNDDFFRYIDALDPARAGEATKVLLVRSGAHLENVLTLHRDPTVYLIPF